MKKLICLVIVLAIAILMALTVPEKKEHKQAMMKAISEYVDEEAVEGMLSDLGKRGIGLSGTNLAEVLPEAVRTDPEARLCINYHAVVTMLIEAVKEQQNEIERLQQILEENGLMRKQP
jgi:hypothetical protein